MTRAVHRAGFRPLAFASRHLLLRPAALKIAASIVLTLLALGLYSLSRGSYPLPASTLARALLAPQEMGEQPRFILLISACRDPDGAAVRGHAGAGRRGDAEHHP